MGSTKRKTIILIISLCLILIGSFATIVAVFAARNASVSSSFTISYTADKIKATISGKYQILNCSEINLTPSVITFDGSESTDGSSNKKSFDNITDPIILTSTNNSVTFTYTITNQDAQAINISLSEDPDVADDNLAYSYNVTFSTVAGSTASTSNTYNNLATGLASGQVATVKVTIAISNLDVDVDDVQGSLLFSLTH